jgi:hypothetical protein
VGEQEARALGIDVDDPDTLAWTREHLPEWRQQASGRSAELLSRLRCAGECALVRRLVNGNAKMELPRFEVKP